MIIAEQTSSPVDTNSLAAPSRFKIKASARAFKILSGFYSDPVLAIPRELGANAWDSHVSAENTDKMFEVHAPNTLEPWFSIRDFGIGLSAEAVDQIYTTYFESTKTGDNESDGCMGLGSKTPFNYTENFTVTSWFNGIKYVYNCFIDQSGAPNIMQLAKEMSTEHNGVEVKFGVKPADISMFVDKIKIAYAPFRFKPVIKGAAITYPEVKTLYKGQSWALRDKGDRYNHESRAFMGNYSYPINTNSLFSGRRDYDDKDYTKVNHTKVNQLLGNGSVDLFFDIGDLEVAPNKEQLQYDADQRTQKAILAAAVVAFDELKKQIESSIEIPKTLWQALHLHWKYNSYSSPFSSIRNIIGGIDVKFNGAKVESSDVRAYDLNSKLGLYDTSASANNYRYQDTNVMKDGSIFSLKNLIYNGRSDQFKLGRHNTGYSGQVENPIIFYTHEGAVKKSRVREYLKKKFSGSNTKIPDTILIRDTSAGFATVKAHQKYFGLDDSCFINIESLPKPTRAARVKPVVTATAADSIYYINVSDAAGGRRCLSYWRKQSSNFEAAGTYYYTDFLWSDASHEGKQISMNATQVLLSEGVRQKLIGEGVTVWGINKKNKRLLKTGTWINAIDLVKKHVVKNKKSLEQYLYATNVGQTLGEFSTIRNRLAQYPKFTESISNPKTRKLFENFMQLFTLCSTDSDKNLIADFCGIKAVKHTDLPIDSATIRKLLNDTYLGVFDIVDFYSLRDSHGWKKLTDIINFIDKNT